MLISFNYDTATVTANKSMGFDPSAIQSCSETVITRDLKPTWEWHHNKKHFKPSKNASIKEKSDDKEVQGRNAIKPGVEEPRG